MADFYAALNTVIPEQYGPNAPLYPSAILFPAFTFPSWILCIAPTIWHFRQANIAAGSLILWIILNNFFNSFNAIIWPRDNFQEWWDGHIWCDIDARIQVGSYVGMTASVSMVVRKLAIVMDTRNMTVSTSRNSKVKAKIWEVVWCWVIPVLFVLLYEVVRGERYMIFGIVGCYSSHDSSWPSVVTGFMWPTIGMLFASYWASLLIYRLYRYRREFHRMVAAHSTTSSRFIRLVIISLVVILVYTSYSIYQLDYISHQSTYPYSWSAVHDPIARNHVTKVPVNGVVGFEKWVQVATGYITFCLLGTGVDANAHYRRMLVRIGAGKIWPSLYAESDGGSRAPKSFSAARAWTSSVSSKAKRMFWSSSIASTKTGSTSTTNSERKDAFTDSTSNNSVILDSIPRLHSVTTQDTLLSQKNNNNNDSVSPSPASPSSPRPSFFKRWFARPSLNGPLLPLFSHRRNHNITEITSTTSNTSTSTSTSTNKTYTHAPSTTGVHAHAWAPSPPSSSFIAGGSGHAYGNSVHVIREVYQQRDEKTGSVDGDMQVGKEMKDWA